MKPLSIPQLHVADIELPRSLDRLYDIAYNLWWTWAPEAQRLFASIDNRAWTMYRNPVQLLINVEPQQWYSLVESETFRASYESTVQALDRYMEAEDTWMARSHGDHGAGPIAYFGMEYGLHECLPIYSGGLGVLSADQCKSASDLGVPFVGVGLLYRSGYFRQTLDSEGHQQHYFPEADFSRLPIRPAATRTGKEVVVEVPFPRRQVKAKIWVAQVGRVPLLLLDTDILDNHAADRPITNILYVQGREARLSQELVLGVGGVRALRALDIRPAVYHLNEGHSSLLQVERLRELFEGDPEADLEQGRELLRRNSVFTTHTPVPAGNERFAAELAAKYMRPLSDLLGVDPETLLDLGRTASNGDASELNLTALAIRTSSFVNGVSRINAEVLNPMWKELVADSDGDAFPIEAITNGVHTATWIGQEIRSLLEIWLGPDWSRRLLEPEEWEHLMEIPDVDLWNAHQAQKMRLFRHSRGSLRSLLARHGRSADELRQVDSLLDPEVLTVGFARRFATYKRANLIFTDLERIKALLTSRERPLQILFAGKAHPADRPGQELIQQIFELRQEEELKGHLFFLEDYSLRTGRMLVQGVDVWLNTPRPPLEASGTSGQKAAVNGVLNCSVPDGWWPEGHDGENGWVFGGEADGDGEGDEGSRNERDAEALYRVLEEEILPTYYDRDGELPGRWIARMKRAMITIAPRFSSHRMVREYVERAYLPAAARGAEAREPAGAEAGGG